MTENNGGNAKMLLKNTGIFAIGTFGSKVLSLLIIPLCTFYIDTTSMGVYDMDYTVITLLQPIAMLSLSEGLFRWLLDETLEKRKVFSTWAGLFTTFMLVFTTVFWMVWTIVRFDDAPLLYLLVVFGCAYICAQFGTRGLHANKLFAASGILYTVVYCALTYLLVVVVGVGYRGLLIAILVATLVSTVVLVVVQPELRNATRRLFDRSMAKEMLHFSVFLLPNQLSWWALTWLGRLFIVGILGYAANGIYSVAMKFPSALSMVSNVFLPAWQEQLVSLYGNDGTGEYFSKIFRRYAILLFSILLPGVPFTVLFIRLFMDSAYSGAAELVAILYLGACFSALTAFMGVLFLCSRNTSGAAIVSGLGATAMTIASAVLVPSIGLRGAAAASTLGYFVMFVSDILMTRKYLDYCVPWRPIVVLLVLAVLLSVAANVIGEIWQLALLILTGALIALIANRNSLSWIVGMVRGRSR